MHPLFYEPKADRVKKKTTEKLLAKMMEAYRQLFDKNKAAWDNTQ